MDNPMVVDESDMKKNTQIEMPFVADIEAEKSAETLRVNGIYNSFKDAFEAVEEEAHNVAKNNGWWEAKRNDGELIALIHSEVSEALEALRHGNPPSEHIPEYSGAEEELADVIIRCMDLAKNKEWDLAGAVAAKIEFNKTRGYKHGGKKF